MKSILDIIIEYAGTNERMDSFVLDDPHYQELLQEIDTATIKLEKNSSIDEVLSCYNAANAYYIQKTYEQGLLDCIELLKELKIL